jgi:N-methylhydantoinase B
VEIEGDRITVDFSEVSEQRPGPFNAGRHGGAGAAARISIKYLFSPGEPVNEGDFRPLTVVIPDGKFISATGTVALGSSGNMIPTVVDTVLRALAQAMPGRAAAAHHGTYGVHAFHGISPHTGRQFYNHDTLCGGWGASESSDGYGPSRSNAHGDTSNVPIEMQEAFCPYIFESYAMRADSGGPGKYRGGVATEKVYRITAACRLNLKIDRTKCPPWGLQGGKSGAVSDVEISHVNGSVSHVLKGDHPLQPGDIVTMRSAGGGGFGPPWERETCRVLDDVSMGYVSLEAARSEYGVAILEDGSVDEAATRIIRSAIAQSNNKGSS